MKYGDSAQVRRMPSDSAYTIVTLIEDSPLAAEDDPKPGRSLFAQLADGWRQWIARYLRPRLTRRVHTPARQTQFNRGEIPGLPPPPGQLAAIRAREARARRRLGQDPHPPLVKASVSAVAAPPWAAGGVSPSVDPDVVRPHLIGTLFEISDQCQTDADRSFLLRLIRLMGTDQLDLPPFPDVAWQLDKLLHLGDPPLVRVVQLIRREPALVRRVWTSACSAFYARPPNSLDHAVARIGFDALWRIGMSACIHAEVFRVRGFQGAAGEVRQHGIVVADVAAWLSGKKLGAVYLAGLLHDVGKLMVFKAAAPKKGVPIPDLALVERVGAQLHAAIGVLVAHAWRLGPEVAAGIGFHHDPSQAPAQFLETALQVQVANIATHTAMLSREGQDCGGLLELLNLEGIHFDVARTIGKAHEIIDGIEQQAGQDEAPALGVVPSGD